jgi:hypothetical protein
MFTPILKRQLEAEYIQFNLDNRDKRILFENELKRDILGENLIETKAIFDSRVDFINTLPELMDRRFAMEIALEVWSQKFLGARTGVAYKQQLLYSTLNKVDSSIANLIQQLTPLTETLYDTLKSEFIAWTTEINDNLQDALKDDARTIRESFSEASVSASSKIRNYKKFSNVSIKSIPNYTPLPKPWEHPHLTEPE